MTTYGDKSGAAQQTNAESTFYRSIHFYSTGSKLNSFLKVNTGKDSGAGGSESLRSGELQTSESHDCVSADLSREHCLSSF